MAILYTEAQVENAQLRALVAMYEISQKIQNGFYYFYSPIYKTYKTLQYDIYTLYDVISHENPYVTYNPTPTTYESQFYELVGSLINKTKQFDVFGQFGGAVNPNYQSATVPVVINDTSGDSVAMIEKDETNLISDGFGGYYLPFTDEDGNPFLPNVVPIQITIDGVGIAIQANYDFYPMRLYGFANNAAQTIILTVI